MVKKNQNFFQVGVREADVTTERSQEAMSLQGRGHILFYQVEYELSITEVDIFNTVEILVHYEIVTQGSWNHLDGDGQCTLRRGGEMKDEDRQPRGVSLHKGQRGKQSKNEKFCEARVVIESSPLEKMWFEVLKYSEY